MTEVPASFLSLNRESFSSLEPAFKAILARPVSSPSELERLILDWSELEAYVDDVATEIGIAASLNSDDHAAQERKRRFLQDVQPKLEEMNNQFCVTVLGHAEKIELPAHYDLFLKILRSDRDIFHPDNPGLSARAAQLAQEYDVCMAGLTVSVRGKTYTPPQVNGPINTADRELRRELWSGVWGARRDVSEKVDTIFEQQLQLRHQIALNAGFANYRDYSFLSMRRFYYSPLDAKRLHDTIAEHIVPVARARYEAHRRRLGVEKLMPWDIGSGRFHEVFVKPYASELGGFGSAQEVEVKAGEVLASLNAEMAREYDAMRTAGEADLVARPGKSPGAYQAQYSFKRRPFIFANNTGVIDDLYTTLHEFGHAYHYLQFRDEPVMTYRQIPMEIAELGSMACELLGHNRFELFLSPEEARVVRADKYESIAFFLAYMAQVDAFQQWIYEHPDHSRQERRRKWEELTDRFGPPVSWEGIEEFKGMYWHQQLHVFRYPFYYIEYGIAQLGALQVELNFHRDGDQAIEKWRSALALGASRPLPELYQQAGIPFDFSPAAIKPVGEMLARLAAA